MGEPYLPPELAAPPEPTLVSTLCIALFCFGLLLMVAWAARQVCEERRTQRQTGVPREVVSLAAARRARERQP